ncbi:MAG: hypothetical protein K0R28_7041, partial [Paenibacillus sp.]|nr:hypothetical protein [Paenibacillus sp.]
HKLHIYTAGLTAASDVIDYKSEA